MNLFLNYSERRQSQLDAIDKIDNILVNSTCKDVIASYLMWTRKVNKTQFEQFSKASWWKKTDLLEEDLAITDNHLKDVQSRLDSGEDPCIFLLKYFTLSSLPLS